MKRRAQTIYRTAERKGKPRARKQPDSVLLESEQRFRALADDAPILIWLSDEKANNTYANRAFLDFVGLKHYADYAGKAWEKTIHPDDVGPAYATFLEAARDHKPFIQESRLRHGATGQFRWHLFKGIPRWVDGKFAGFIGTGMDIHEQKRAEQHLAEQARLLDLSNDAIIVRDSENRITYWNRGAEELYGWTREEARGQNADQLLRTEYAEPRQNITAALQHHRRWQGELIHTRKDGSRVTVSSRWALDAKRGRTRSILETNNDITARKQAVEALEKSEQRYRTLFNSIDEGFCTIEVLFDQNGKAVDYRFLEMNPSFERQTGLRDARGRRVRELVPNHEENWFEIYGRIALTGEPARFENRAKALGRWYDVFAFRIDDPKLHRVAVLFNDITARKQAQLILETTVAERTASLKETVGELEAFSYTIAHDMRAPLRAMQSFSAILTKDYSAELDQKAKAILGRIELAAGRLDRLIQDVLDYSKIVRSDLQLEPVDTQVLLEEIIHTYPNLQPQAADISFKTSLPEVLGNRAALTQVFANLLGNAVKFVAPGVRPQVFISAEPVATTPAAESSPLDSQLSAAGQSARLWFEDNGIGIDPEHKEGLFQMFHRAHPPGLYEGTGMGLAIVRKAVERMGGRVGVESQPGKGSRFWVELRVPSAPKDSLAEPVMAAAPTGKRRRGR